MRCTAHCLGCNIASKLAPVCLNLDMHADIGANLTDDMYKGVYGANKQYHEPDLPVVLERAWAAGVQRIIVTGGSLEGSRAALALARTDSTQPQGLQCVPGSSVTQCLTQAAQTGPTRSVCAQAAGATFVLTSSASAGCTLALVMDLCFLWYRLSPHREACSKVHREGSHARCD